MIADREETAEIRRVARRRRCTWASVRIFIDGVELDATNLVWRDK